MTSKEASYICMVLHWAFSKFQMLTRDKRRFKTCVLFLVGIGTVVLVELSFLLQIDDQTFEIDQSSNLETNFDKEFFRILLIFNLNKNSTEKGSKISKNGTEIIFQNQFRCLPVGMGTMELGNFDLIASIQWNEEIDWQNVDKFTDELRQWLVKKRKHFMVTMINDKPDHEIDVLIPKSNKSSLFRPFSSQFFGGTRLKYVEMCHSIDKCLSHLGTYDFDRCFNLYLRGNDQPQLLVSQNGNKSFEISPKKASNFGNETTFSDFVKLRRAQFKSQQRQKLAKAISTRLHELFKKTMTDQFVNQSSTDKPLRFLSYSCELWMTCGGFGDRLKGIAALLYLAIASDRYFHIEMLKPIGFDRYFRINSKWYDGISRNDYLFEVRRANVHRLWQWAVDEHDQELVEMVGNYSSFSNHFSEIDNIEITSNRFNSIQAIFDNPYYKDKIISVLPEFSNYESETKKLDLGILISAAFQFVMQEPTFDMNKLVEKIFIDNQVDQVNNFKIGIQIRTCLKKWYEEGTRVDEAFQLKCFVEKVLRITNHLGAKIKNVTIFVTSDSDSVVNKLRQIFQSVDNSTITFNIFDTSEYLQNTPHLDRTSVKSSDRHEQWLEMAKVFVDWYILSKMDVLLISRSSYGETASLMSLVPTWQFIHTQHQKAECPFLEFNIFKN